MSAALLAERPAFPAFVTLPEPPANRAQTIPGSIVVLWLTGVMQRDLDGYALIAGNGRTITVLYGRGKPLSSAVTRGPDGAGLEEALGHIQTGGAGCFVMTYKLPETAGHLLSGLFAEPVCHVLRRTPQREIGTLLRGVLEPAFNGAVVVWSEESIWAVLLVESGAVCACYGAEDRTLKSTLEDVTHLLYLDEVAVSVYPSRIAPGIAATLAAGSVATGQLVRTTGIDRTEAAMIAMLSQFEHRLSRITSAESGPAELTLALAETLDAATTLAGDDGPPVGTGRPSHPLLAVHWDRETGHIAVQDLLANLKMAAIPDAWLAASDALVLGLDDAVEQQLTWLAVADEVSATTLHDALDDLLQQARHLLKVWRAERQPALDRR